MPELSNLEEMTNEKCQDAILDLGKGRGINLNPVSGIPGEFYRFNRAEDIRQVCLEILNERNFNEKIR